LNTYSENEVSSVTDNGKLAVNNIGEPVKKIQHKTDWLRYVKKYEYHSITIEEFLEKINHNITTSSK